MSSKKISLESIDLGEEINAILKAYSSEIQEEINELAKQKAKDGAKRLQQRSPKRTGKYAKGWTTTTSTKTDARGIKTTTATIYNKNKPTLTHLLENDHATRNGGTVKGRKHIEPVYNEIQEEFINEAVEIIKNTN